VIRAPRPRPAAGNRVPSTADSGAATGEEKGVSLVRKDEGATFLRRRIERPALLGQYILETLGAVTAGAGVALWLTDRSSLGLAMGAFGAVLVALGVVQFLILRRDRAHWPDEVVLWEGGVELMLHNGDVRGASWTDPDLALNLISRRAPATADREYLLVWMSEGKIPSAELSADGFERLRRAAESEHLLVTEPRPSRHADGPKWIEIRPGAAGRPMGPTAASGEAVPP